MNQLKKDRIRKRIHSDESPEEQAGNNNTEDVLSEGRIRNAILKLNPKYRAVVVLRLIKGYSTQEAAEILNAPQGTVMSWLARAQKALRNDLKTEI